MIALLSFGYPVAAQHAELQPGYYVVVGAYAETKEDIAIRYVNKLKADGHEASHGFNSSRNLYFVYLQYHTDLKESVRSMLATRKNKAFADAWVRVVPGDIKPQVVQAPPVKEAPTQPETTPLNTEPEDSVWTEPEEKIIQHDPMTLGNTEVFLSLYNGPHNRIVDGQIEVFDADRSKSITKVDGNEYLIIQDPQNNTGKIRLVADVFGYRRVERELTYSRPLADTAKAYVDLMGTTFVVHFDMVQYKTGDRTLLDNIVFYNDAALMMPESKSGLEALLWMLNDDKNYRIRLHGHTNGNFRGDIITMGPSRNYFNIAPDSKRGSGSSKELSEKRAEIIKLWLMDNGVDASRIEVVGWGGKQPLYDVHSVNAKKNVRVELEIVQD